MKFICIRPVEIEEGFYGNLSKNGNLATYMNQGKTILNIVPGEYSVSYNKTDTIVLHKVNIQINNSDNLKISFLKIDKNALLNDGYFEGDFLERIFFKNNINKLNTKNPNYVSEKEKEETIKEAKQILKNISIDILKQMPVSMKSSVILSDLNRNNIKELDKNQLKEINEIIKYPYYGNGYDYNIIDEIHNIKDLEEIYEKSIYADLGIYPKYKQTCKKCGHTFYLNNSEIEWYLNKNLNIPKTCEFCRKGLKRPDKIESKSKISNESLEEETVKTEMQIALEKAGVSITEQK